MFRKIQRLFLYFIGILIILLCLAASLSLIFKDKITVLVLAELNKRLQIEIKVKKINFSIFRKFPYACIEFEEVYSGSSPNYIKKDLHTSNDTLFNFKSLFLEFSIYDLLNKNYRISKIHANKGMLNLARDKSGNYNYLIWKNTSKTDTNKLTIDLQNFKLTDIHLSYSDFKDHKNISLQLNKCQVKCSLSSLKYEFSSQFISRIIGLKIDNLDFPSNKEVNGQLNLKIINEKILLENSSLTVDHNSFILNGIYNSKNLSESKLNLKNNHVNIENLLILLPEKVKRTLVDYNFKGNLSANASIYYSGLNSQVFEIDITPIQSSLSLDYEKIKLTNLGFNGHLYLEMSDSFGVKRININNIKGKLDGNLFVGSFSVVKSKTTTFNILWKGKSSFTTLNKLILNDTLSQILGNFDGTLEIKGDLKGNVSITKNEIAHFDYKGEINLEDIKILKPQLYLGISAISGRFRVNKDIVIENSDVIFKENHLTGSGKIENFLPWLLTKNETLSISGNIQCQLFNLDKMISQNVQSKNDTSETHFPNDLVLEVKVNFNEFLSGKFKALNVAGKISYRPMLFDLRSLYFETMEGNLTGSAIIIQKPDYHFIFKTQSLLDRINISTLFSTFNNFGQSLIDYRNIKGKISGLLNLSSEWNNSFSILTPSILLDGTLKIENGELIEFEPLNGLSRYINVEELKHIYFSTLQNDIFIRNRIITIPQMNIKSSNFDIIGSGTHDFDNNFNYKIKVVLSELLYKKAKKSNNQIDEFGVLETEVTRKISLPLTVKGNIDNYKVSYDPKQAAENMIQNLKNEKKQLKALLKEEFGLFKNDSLTINKTQKKRNNNILIEFDNDKYLSGKKTDQNIKTKLIKQKEARHSKDTSKIKIEFQ